MIKKILRLLLKIAIWIVVIHIAFIIFGYFFQEKLIFQPEKLPKDFKYSFVHNFEEVNLKAEDGAIINALHFKIKNPKGVILYFHGNSGSLKGWGNVVRYFTDYQYDVFMIDFRGYGKSTGTLDDELMYQDAQMSYDYVKQFYNEDKIIPYGKSMGTTFATRVAADNNPQQLILEVPFYNLAAAGKHRFPFAPMFLLNYKFETNKYIKEVKCPITFFHGTEDWITPYDDSVRLFEEATVKDKEFITIEGGHHNDLVQYAKYNEVLKQLLE